MADARFRLVIGDPWPLGKPRRPFDAIVDSVTDRRAREARQTFRVVRDPQPHLPGLAGDGAPREAS